MRMVSLRPHCLRSRDARNEEGLGGPLVVFQVRILVGGPNIRPPSVAHLVVKLVVLKTMRKRSWA